MSVRHGPVETIYRQREILSGEHRTHPLVTKIGTAITQTIIMILASPLTVLICFMMANGTTDLVISKQVLFAKDKISHSH